MTRMRTATVRFAALMLVACSLTTTTSMDSGAILYHDGQYVAAVDAFSAAIAASPHSAAAWNNRAAARLRAGEVTGAIADYTRAVELAPSDPEIAYNRGNAFVAAGRYQDAIARDTEEWKRRTRERSPVSSSTLVTGTPACSR